MPNPRLAMTLIREVLRLKYESNLSHRQIARALRISVGSVANYLAAVERCGLEYPLRAELTDDVLAGMLSASASKALKEQSFAPPDYAYIHEQLKIKGITRQLLWEEYVAAHPAGHYRYTQFCFYYRRWKDKLKVSLRQTHRAGEKMFVDYCGKTVSLVDAATGEVREVQVFVVVLGASNYTYAEATVSQKLEDRIGSHVRAFEFFGGVPEMVVPDNLKSGVKKACRYEPLLNDSYQLMLEHYRTRALPARPYKPRDKAKVETAVQMVERWILARLGNRTFFSLFELNLAIRALLTELIWSVRPERASPWLACALGNQACRQGLSVKYERVPPLLENLRIAHADGSFGKKLLQMTKTDLLILDDFGIKPLARGERHDLLEVIEERHGLRSTLVTSQLPISLWHEYLGEPTVADALLDRLMHNAFRIELKGESLRRTKTDLTDVAVG